MAEYTRRFRARQTHPLTSRLEGKVYALDDPNQSGVNAQSLPVYDLVPRSNPPLQVVPGFSRRVHSIENGLYKPVASLEVEYSPVEDGRVKSEDERTRFPTYVLRIRQPAAEPPGVPTGNRPTPIHDREKVASVFSNLLASRKLTIQEHGFHPETRHWNFNHKTRGNVYAVRREGEHLVLIASDANDLLELADHYFHYAQPVGKNKSLPARASALRATAYVSPYVPSGRHRTQGQGTPIAARLHSKAKPSSQEQPFAPIPGSVWFRSNKTA